MGSRDVRSALLRAAPCELFLTIAGFLAACGDLKTAAPADGGSTSISAAAPAPDAGGTGRDLPATPTSGPGLHGSLPSGYCCTDDSECRSRHCTAAGSGGKMCQDACGHPSTCERRDLSFVCSAAFPETGWCVPPSPSFTCLPQASFQRGSRAAGECCAELLDGNTGEECEGNLCVGVDQEGESNPAVCSHRCELTRECPTGMICGPTNSCVPANHPYTCK
jgi:hypothetical protein